MYLHNCICVSIFLCQILYLWKQLLLEWGDTQWSGDNEAHESLNWIVFKVSSLTTEIIILRNERTWDCRSNERPTRNSGLGRLFLTFLGIPAVSHSKSRRASSEGSRSFTRLVWASNLVDPSRKEHRAGGNCSPREDHSVLAQKFLWRMGLRTAIVDTHIHNTHTHLNLAGHSVIDFPAR